MDEKQKILYNIFYKEISPKIADIEIFRRKLLNKVLLQVCLFIPFIGLLLGIVAYSENKNIYEAVFIAIIFTILFIIALYFLHPNKKIFANKMKKDYFLTVLKAFVEIKLWQSNQAVSNVIPDKELVESGLFGMFTERKNDDEFKGIYKNVEFCVSESQLVLNDGFRRPTTIFKGLIIKFNSNKKIGQRTIIATQKEVSNSFRKALLGFIFAVLICLIKIGFGSGGLIIGGIAGLITALMIYFYLSLNLTKKESDSDIKLESPEFSKHFKVFSEDNVEARYLLTPTFIEKLTRLKNIMEANSVKCSFYGNSLMISIYSDKDFFEIGDLFKNVTYFSTVEKFYKDLSAILDLVDYFNLDSKTGL